MGGGASSEEKPKSTPSQTTSTSQATPSRSPQPPKNGPGPNGQRPGRHANNNNNDDASPLESMRVADPASLFGDDEEENNNNNKNKKPMLLRSNTQNMNGTQFGRTGFNSTQRETALGISTASSKNVLGGGTNTTTVSASSTAAGAAGGSGSSPNSSTTQYPVNELNRTASKANSAFTSAKTRARVAEREAQEKAKQENVERLASTQNMNLLNGTVTTAALSASARDARHVVNGTAKIKNLCETMNKFRLQMKKHKEVSDSDIAELKRTQDHYAQLKNNFAQQIISIGEHVDVVGKPNRQVLYDLLEGIMNEGEVRDGSQSLLRACITHFTPLDWQVDFAVGGKKMIAKCVHEGWFQFLDILLGIQSLVVASSEDAQILITEDAARKAAMAAAASSPVTSDKKKKKKKNGEDEDDDDFLADVEEDADPFADVDGAQLESDSDSEMDASITSASRSRRKGGANASATSPPSASLAAVDPQLREYLDPIDLLKKCWDNPRSRIPLLGTLCKHWSKLRFVEYANAMLPTWTKIVHTLCSSTKSNRGEDRTQRIGLLNKILSLSSCIPVNVNEIETSESEDTQHQHSLISRSIVDGETAVFQALTRKAGDVDWSVILPDGHSLLTLACQCAQKSIVEILLNHPEIDIHYNAPGHGTALEIVQVEGGSNQQIIALIEGKIQKLEEARSKEERERLAAEEKSHHKELKKKAAERRRKIQDRARKAQPPQFILDNVPPTGPPGVDPENDEDWIYGWHRDHIKPIILTGPILDIVNTLREHWTLIDSLTGGGPGQKKKSFLSRTNSMAGTTKSAENAVEGSDNNNNEMIAKVEVIDDKNEDDLSDIDSDDENGNGKKRRKSVVIGDGKQSSFMKNSSRSGSNAGSRIGSRKTSFAAKEENKDDTTNNNNINNDETPTTKGEVAGLTTTTTTEKTDETTGIIQGHKKVDAQINFDEEKKTFEVSVSAVNETWVREVETYKVETAPRKKEIMEESLSVEQEEAAKATATFLARFDDRAYLLDGETLRTDLIQTILSFGLRIQIEGKDPKEKVFQAVGRLLQESEKSKGSLKLARIMMYRIISVDFAPAVSGTHKWALHAATRGDLEALETLLRVDKLWRAENEVVELTMCCVRHKEKRFQLCLLLLRHQKELRFGTYRDHLRPLWEELIETTSNPSKINFSRLTEHEKTLRFELYCRLFNNPNFFPIRHDIEITKGITYFSRACRIGDMDFVKACVFFVVCDINRVYSNKSTPLMQAIVGNQLEVVKILCECSDIDPFAEGPDDAIALDIAKQMNRDQEMLEVIVGAMERATVALEGEDQQTK